MLLVLLGLLVLAANAISITETEYRNAFDAFKVQYGKTYLETEENHRYNIFKDNFDFVTNWDEEIHGFQVGINEFADLSSDEFVSIYNGMRVTVEYEPVVEDWPLTVDVTGDIVNWVNKGAVTPVKNQGQCGSCWSFSSTGSLEGSKFIATGTLTSLSEQNLVDCSTAQGNDGCNGGLMDSAFTYVVQNKGIDTEASYPYTATGPNSCKFKAADIGDTISGHKDVSRGSESALQTAVTQQPISVAIDASHNSFQLYKSGVYYEPACSASQLDHGVLAVGYGTSTAGTDYWLVKNSWGASWGMSGYIQMSKGRNNNCGIATMASYPVQ
jgi:cathepsin L